MTITNEPIVENSPVKFKVTGFPEENSVRSAIERFYGLKKDADRNFLIFNAFDEQIFSGLTGEEGKILNLTANSRPGKAFNSENKPQ